MMGPDEDSQLQTRIRTDQGTDEVVIDPTTPMEMLTAAPGAVGLALIVVGAPLYVVDRVPDAWTAFKYGFLLLALAVVLVQLVEVNYRLDLDERVLSIYGRFFIWEGRRRICDFSGIHCVVMDNYHTLRQSRRKRWHEIRHGLVIVLESGKVLRAVATDFSGSRTVTMHGERLATFLGVPFVSEPGRLSVRKNSSGVSLHWEVPSMTTTADRAGSCCGTVVVSIMLVCWVGSSINQYQGTLPQWLQPAPLASPTPPPATKTYGVDLSMRVQRGKASKVVIVNTGDEPLLQDVGVLLESKGKRVGTRTIKAPMRPSGETILSLPPNPQGLKITVDPRNVLKETNETNNVETL